VATAYGLKRCPRCDAFKWLDDFTRDRSTKDGRSPWCRVCESEYGKRYYEKHRERLLAQDRERYAARSEEERERDRAKDRAYYKANRERERAKQRLRYWAEKGEPQPAYSRNRGKEERVPQPGKASPGIAIRHEVVPVADDDPLAILESAALKVEQARRSGNA
jgi:hypothetical protein